MNKSKLLAIATLASLTLFAGCAALNQQDHVNCQVLSKDMVYDSNDQGGVKRVKRVATSCGSFNVEDNIVGGFNSWDLWAQIQEGERYDFRTGGYRIGFFSQFPYVLEVKHRE
ncbi:hypothetical protein [Mycolicibacterium phlei]|uniref:hypothetical protein n=1 Tax=Mycolicibacterium phlei TaxID=1771 RepID=UPI0003024077|nr:hypothetical protein [Mycolicibacterium phlei]MBF4194559.1 putative secreted protein [Mycolicibacterium phlei]